ncbi:MAG: dTMP kinase [Rickettsiaceae bacterium]|nr:dTMP kinase [Rickettsiaceae bacterium]
MTVNNKAKFITFEGGEGSGKSTQSKMLYEYLLSKNIKAIHTREIGGTPTAEKIREIIIHNELLNKSELLLVMGARYEHINKVIIPALLNDTWVICDRFIDSTACYQSIGSADFSITDIYKLHQELMTINVNDIKDLTTNNHSKNSNANSNKAWQTKYFKNNEDSSIVTTNSKSAAEISLMPDMTFFIDVKPSTGLKRTITRGDNNKFESKELEFHQQVYDCFKLIAKQHSPRIITISGENNNIDEVHQEIIRKINI